MDVSEETALTGSPHTDRPAAGELHRQVFERNRAVQLVLDPITGAILEANPAACRFYGYSREQLTAMRITEINVLPPADVRDAMTEVATGRRGEFLFRHRLASGEVRDVEVHSGPIEVGGRTLLYSIIRDVTDRQQALEALRASEASFRLLFANNPEPMWVYDLETLAILEVNDAMVARYGWSRDELLRMRITDIRPPEEVPRLLDAVRSGLPGLQHAGLWQHLTRDGKRFLVEIVSHTLPFNGRAAALAVAQDVTERRAAETALRESEDQYRRLVDLMPIAIAIHSEGKLVFANRAGAALLGAASPEELQGRSLIDLIHPDYRSVVAERLSRIAEGVPAPPLEEKLIRLDRSVVDVEVAATPFSYRGRQAVQVVVRDVTERKRAERLQSALYRIADQTGSVENIEAFYAAIHGIVGELMYARNFYIALSQPDGSLGFPYFVDECDPVPPQIVKPGKTLTEYVLRTREPLLASPLVFEELVRSGEVENVGGASVDWLGAPLRRGDQCFGAIVVQSYTEQVRFTEAERDLLNFVAQHVAVALDRKRAQDALRESEARFRTLADTAPCGIFMYQGTRFVYVNEQAAELTGYGREELLQTSFWDVVDPEFQQLVRERGLRRQRGEVTPTRYEFKIRHKSGQERWVLFSAGTIEYQGRPAALGTTVDITERKRAEEQIRNLAYHDTLTSLPNRLLFNDRLEVALAQAHRHSEKLAVLFLDVDRFKVFNDSFGHALGDELLKTVAERLLACVREGDTVARLGGDEFILLIPGVQRPADVAKVAEKILDALRLPVEIGGHSLFVTASMGISIYPDDGDEPEALVKSADAAMYRAKEEGRDHFQLCTPAMSAKSLERMALESGLRAALGRDELVVHYQPVVEIASGRVREVEALVRWRHPERGLIGPGEFLPLAELTGVILQMGPWLLHTACAQAKAWRERGLDDLTVSVNLSPRQFRQADLPAQVSRALSETALPAAALALEITEAAALHNPGAGDTLRALRAIGVRVTVDDFGIGASSLSLLKGLPVDSLKIDRSLVRAMNAGPRDAAMVEALVHTAHTLGLKAVAEGVETEEQRLLLASWSCDRLQGFIVSPALPAEECLLRMLQPLPNS